MGRAGLLMSISPGISPPGTARTLLTVRFVAAPLPLLNKTDLPSTIGVVDSQTYLLF